MPIKTSVAVDVSRLMTGSPLELVRMHARSPDTGVAGPGRAGDTRPQVRTALGSIKV